MKPLEILSSHECLRLLGEGGVARIGLPGAAGPAAPEIRPVNFVLRDREIIVRAGEGLLLDAAREGAPATLEIDGIDRLEHDGWSVIASGSLHLLPDDDRTRALPLRPWAPGERDSFVALSIDELSGRRIRTARAPAAQAESAEHWGRTDTAGPATGLFRALYRHWFRVEWEGIEKIPASGGALLVANHAGMFPFDGALVQQGVEEERGRPVYTLAHHGFWAVPFVGDYISRGGAVVAHPDNANRLLRDDGQLVLVFPEGAKGPEKGPRERYRLQRFGRGGFVETALRAGVPIVPVVLSGTEDATPTVAALRVAGVQLPITLNLLLLGPLGLLAPLPVKIRIQVLDPLWIDAPPGLARYSRGLLTEQAEAIRGQMQAALDEMRAHRRDIWRG